MKTISTIGVLLTLLASTAAQSGMLGRPGLKQCNYLHNLDLYHVKFIPYGSCPDVDPPVVNGIIHTIVGDLPITDPRYQYEVGVSQKIDNHDCLIKIVAKNSAEGG